MNTRVVEFVKQPGKLVVKLTEAGRAEAEEILERRNKVGINAALFEVCEYQRLKEAGVPLDNHESDLYAKVTPESTIIITGYENVRKVTGKGAPLNVSTFKSNIDGTLWYDIPFAFDPWWEARK